jgi:S-adenosylmethionine:diacylglycerol 3-amino-3-carboxypropyl transferase
LFRMMFDTSIAAALAAVRLLTPLDSGLPARGFGAVLRARLERSLARFPNAGNPYARRLFMGHRAGGGQVENPVRFEHADAAAYLEASASASFDAFSLSNILDGATSGYAQRLRAAVRAAASREAVVVLRSFREPSTRKEEEAAAEDRAIWGSIHRGRAQSF